MNSLFVGRYSQTLLMETHYLQGFLGGRKPETLCPWEEPLILFTGVLGKVGEKVKEEWNTFFGLRIDFVV